MSEPYILALYGSRARGDDDCLSDIDMLYVGSEQNAIRPADDDGRICVSQYSWGEFESMHQYGSLFLLHLKLQSRPVKFNADGHRSYRRLLETLPAYRHSDRDIDSFRLALTDITQAIETGDTSIEFELGYLATTVRHSAILGCYLLGTPEFGRYSAVHALCKATGLPSEIADGFANLYQFRMMIARQAAIPKIRVTDSYIAHWLDWSEKIVEEVARCCRKSKH